MRVAYTMSRFPKVTETFVLREMIELEQLGFLVELFPLRREKATVVQPDAKPYVERAHFTPLVSLSILWSNLVTMFSQPVRYFGTLGTLIRANFGSMRYFAGALGFFPKAVDLARRMKKLGIEHLHAHFASHPAAAAFTIGRLSGIPYSFVAHGSDLHRDQHMLLEKTREAAFVVTISNYNREMILDICGREFGSKVHVVHCGIDTTRFTPRTDPTLWELGQGPFRIVCVGTLHEVKGQTHLIEACRMLAERGVSFECHFVGEGEDEAKLRQQVEDAVLDSQISFHGVLTSDEVLQQLQLADVLVAPSVPSRDGRREGIPVVLMEGMACGLPCIASRLSGIPELVEDGVTGILTPPGDSAGMADALQRLANHSSLRTTYGQKSVEKVHREFGLRENTSQLARLLSGNLQAQGFPVRTRTEGLEKDVPVHTRKDSSEDVVSTTSPGGQPKITPMSEVSQQPEGRLTDRPRSQTVLVSAAVSSLEFTVQGKGSPVALPADSTWGFATGSLMDSSSGFAGQGLTDHTWGFAGGAGFEHRTVHNATSQAEVVSYGPETSQSYQVSTTTQAVPVAVAPKRRLPAGELPTDSSCGFAVAGLPDSTGTFAAGGLPDNTGTFAMGSPLDDTWKFAAGGLPDNTTIYKRTSQSLGSQQADQVATTPEVSQGIVPPASGASQPKAPPKIKRGAATTPPDYTLGFAGGGLPDRSRGFAGTSLPDHSSGFAAGGLPSNKGASK